MLRSLPDMLASLDRMWTLILQTGSVDQIIGPRKVTCPLRSPAPEYRLTAEHNSTELSFVPWTQFGRGWRKTSNLFTA